MTNPELIAQFARCVEWQDAEQWIALAAEYATRGYYDNAARCLRLAEAAKFTANGLPRNSEPMQIDSEIVDIH